MFNKTLPAKINLLIKKVKPHSVNQQFFSVKDGFPEAK
jgi:hypothetical protein